MTSSTRSTAGRDPSPRPWTIPTLALALLAFAVPARAQTPSITSIEPQELPLAGGRFEVVIRGDNLAGATAVEVDRALNVENPPAVLAPSGNNPWRVITFMTVDPGAEPGEVIVRVVTPQGQAGATAFLVEPIFEQLVAISNRAGPLDPPEQAAPALEGTGFPLVRGNELPGDRQQVGAGRWALSTYPTGDTPRDSFAEFLSRVTRGVMTDERRPEFRTFNIGPIERTLGLIGPNDYEIRFTENGGHAFRGFFNSSAGENQSVFPVPFELWNVGPDDDPGDDVRLIPVLCEATCGSGRESGVFDIGGDHPVSGGNNDPYSDAIYWYEPRNAAPGDAGYQAWLDAAVNNGDFAAGLGNEILARLVLVNIDGGSAPPYNQALPEPGTVFRIVSVKPNRAPTADFDFACEGLSCSFSDLSTDADGAVTSWDWDFGDGSTSTQRNPSHAYASAGTYPVQLTIRDDDGASDTATRTVLVTANPNQAPTAEFDFACDELSCSFSDRSTDSDGAVTSWDWDFGDGSTSTQRNPSHTFPHAGTYSVGLTIHDDDDASDTATRPVTVEVVYPASVEYDVSRSFGSVTQANSYRLVGLPGDGTIPLASTLDGSPGEHDDWRAFRDNGAAADYLVEFNGSSAFSFRPGRGFWVLAKSAWSNADSVPTVPLDGDGTYAIPVHAGWNIISNPFDVDVAWDQVQALNGVTQGLWRFSGSFSPTGVFTSAKASGEAFYFDNDAGLDALRLPYPGIAQVSAPAAQAPAARELVLTAYVDGRPASSVRAAVADWASSGRNAFDQTAPPGDFETASLRLIDPGSTGRSGFLAAAYRPVERGGTVFELQLDASPERATSVALSGAEAFSDGEVFLIDAARGRFFDMRRGAPVALPGGRYRLVAGTRAFVEEALQATVPDRLVLHENYPNPFRSHTRIAYAVPEEAAGEPVRLDVYDMLGRRIRTLVDGRPGAGLHEVEWDGRDEGGRLAAGGTYVYRLQAGRRNHVRRMLLLR